MTNYEQTLIGCVLIDPTVLDEITLSPGEFFATKHAKIWQTILSQYAQGLAIDALTIGDLLPEESIYLFDCTSQSFTTSNAGFYASKIADAALKQNLMQLGHVLQNDREQPAEELLEQARQAIEDVTSKQNLGKIVSLGEIFNTAVDSIGKMPDYPKSPWGLMDHFIGGFRPGALYVIGARPSVGKTVVGLQIAYHLAKEGSVSFHSLEMPQRELMNRIMAMAGNVRLQNIESGELTNDEWASLATLKNDLNTNLFISEKSSQNLTDIRKIARAAHNQKPLTAIVIDYLQLMSDTERGRKRYESITAISNGLKAIARDLNVPVIALAQLNREVEGRGKDSEPQLADLRDSGSIEQDADVVMLLNRVQAEGDLEWEKTKMYIHVRKNRQGQTGNITLQFQGQFARCVEMKL